MICSSNIYKMISTIFNLKISYIDIIDNNGKTVGKSIFDIS
jgi:hypothetical protein